MGVAKAALEATVRYLALAERRQAEHQADLRVLVGREGADEIWAYGFRNAHRLSWDLADGTMFAADIGMNNIEEINRVTIGGNYGWPAVEGSGSNASYLNPIYAYAHSVGCSITGTLRPSFNGVSTRIM